MLYIIMDDENKTTISFDDLKINDLPLCDLFLWI